MEIKVLIDTYHFINELTLRLVTFNYKYLVFFFHFMYLIVTKIIN